MLGLVVLAASGLTMLVAAAIIRNAAIGACGTVLVLASIAAVIILRAECNPGCELGSIGYRADASTLGVLDV